MNDAAFWDLFLSWNGCFALGTLSWMLATKEKLMGCMEEPTRRLSAYDKDFISQTRLVAQTRPIRLPGYALAVPRDEDLPSVIDEIMADKPLRQLAFKMLAETITEVNESFDAEYRDMGGAVPSYQPSEQTPMFETDIRQLEPVPDTIPTEAPTWPCKPPLGMGHGPTPMPFIPKAAPVPTDLAVALERARGLVAVEAVFDRVVEATRSA